MSGRALVTGATGLVGSHIVARLAKDGWTVRAMVRDPAAARWLEPLGATELVAGDVCDANAVRQAAAGCSTIFHTAAAISPRAGWEAFRSTNIDGTTAIIAAAARSGARLLHLSSVAVYGSARWGTELTHEGTALAPLPDHAYYARSKRESEELVLGAHARNEIWATAVRPNWIYGERDRQFIPRALKLFDLPLIPLIDGGHSILSMVHAGNVTDAAVRAVSTDAAGGRAYNTTNDFAVSVADFVRLGAQGLGRRARTVSVPLWAASGAMKWVKGAVRLARGREMSGHADGIVPALSRDNPFSSDRARRELGWDPPFHPEQAIPAAFRWQREHRGSR
ncbi:MAG TPA: NAD-dependent epimerase/dehydratase family protein [Gemmatimonadaceae bacterium]|nr:NAD-dependent epimerase/dehydratase family protein [Gemmatimonadaceae bacterium]